MKRVVYFGFFAVLAAAGTPVQAGLFGFSTHGGGCHHGDCCPEAECCPESDCCPDEGCCEDDCASTGCFGKKKGGLLRRLFSGLGKRHHLCGGSDCCETDCCETGCCESDCCAPAAVRPAHVQPVVKPVVPVRPVPPAGPAPAATPAPAPPADGGQAYFPSRLRKSSI